MINKEKRLQIQARLAEFKNLSKENQFKEFMFCLLTPQSKAKSCWEAVESLEKLSDFNENTISSILKSKTRFHNTKTKRILNARTSFNHIHPNLSNPNTIELRNYLAHSVSGFGLKESSHFLRNIGLSNNQIAILDRHILKNLKTLNLISDTKIKSKKHYLEIEQIFLDYAKSLKIPADELDLFFWQKENGEIFK